MFNNVADYNTFLPPYLKRPEKNRLTSALEQFKSRENKKEFDSKLYTDFFLPGNRIDHFIQGDLIKEIRNSDWDPKARVFSKIYLTSVLLSNSCDISPDNPRDIPKQAIFAPVMDLPGLLATLKEDDHSDEKISQIERRIKDQNYSNLVYLPPNPGDNTEYVVWLDKVFSFPSEELMTYIPTINAERISSLDKFGLYILLTKLSYHFCRLPESDDRPTIAPEEPNTILRRLGRFIGVHNRPH